MKFNVQRGDSHSQSEASKLAKSRTGGSEKPTIIEKAVKVLPCPYFVKCLIFWIIFGTPGMVLTRYLDTFDISKATALFENLTPQDVIIFSMANLVLPLYAFYGTGYMRKKIVEALPQLKLVTNDGAESLERVFGSISRSAPALVLAILFAVVSIASFPGQVTHILGILSLVVKVVGFTFAMLAYGTFVWMYVSSIRGLHRFGKQYLTFVPFYEDSHLGTKALGSVSLSFAWVYFVGTGLVFFSSAPVPSVLLLALIGLILLGVILFFLPLHVVHDKMTKEKHAAEKLLRKKLSRIVSTLESKDENSSEISDLLMFQILEKKASKVSEWPFDVSTLSWFSAIVITIIGTIITRYLLIFLGL